MPRLPARDLKSELFTTRDIARFWSKVARQGPGDCWLWTAALGTGGYGAFKWGGHAFNAHRWAYALEHGTVAVDLVIDHLCRIPSCVNPDHLEAVPHEVNISRGVARASKITECTAGHQYDDENTGWYTDPRTGERERFCRACKREKRAEYRADPANRAKDRAYAKAHRQRPEEKERHRERQRQYQAAWTPEQRQARNEYLREYHRRKKAEQAESASLPPSRG